MALFVLALRDQINDLEVRHQADLVLADQDLVDQDLADLVLEIILLVLQLVVVHVHHDLIKDLADRDLIADR